MILVAPPDPVNCTPRQNRPHRAGSWVMRKKDQALARRPPVRYILSHMVQYTNAHLDASFAALSDATRRGVLEQLGRAEASITDLAERFDMTLTGMKKHVGVLER